jgi:hypothetical protein
MESKETTIQVNRKVKKSLDTLKLHPKESYNSVMERLLDVEKDDGELSPETLRHIARSLKEIKACRYSTLDQVKKKAGLA